MFLINIFRRIKQHGRVFANEQQVHRAAWQVVTQPLRSHKSNSLTKARWNKIMQIRLFFFTSFD